MEPCLVVAGKGCTLKFSWISLNVQNAASKQTTYDKYRKNPQISRTLNLADQILGKKVFWKKSKEIQSRVLRNLLHPLFIERKLAINIATENTSKSYPQFRHFNKMNISSTNFDIWFISCWYLLIGISSFNTVFP